MAAMARVQRKTLILTTNLTAVRQWQRELRDKCNIDPEDIGEYTGATKNIRSVTVTTYQILTYRRSKTEAFIHFELFSRNDWGLIIYDEVHLLPAPVFRVTAEIQATDPKMPRIPPGRNISIPISTKPASRSEK